MHVQLNDVHSGLNPTRVRQVVRPESIEELVSVIRHAARSGLTVSVAGGRHAMGGQQFAHDSLHIDMTGMDRALHLDTERGQLRMEAGATWPTIIRASHGDNGRWGIRQKQTGADDLTLGGAIAANAHGRGLTIPPISADIESLSLVAADGGVRRCSRDENPELFSLVRGGYGLFGVVADATLRLAPRMRMQRLVDIIDIDDAMNAVYRRVREGCLYGDFQYAIDATDDSFLRRGVFACYRPVANPGRTPPAESAETDLPREAWLALLRLAHTDKREAFRVYARHYLDTHGREYWSDTMQLSTYIPSYAEFLNQALPGGAARSLVITELYVPPDRLIDFMRAGRSVLRRTGVEDIYGTIRAIAPDSETFIPWAPRERACVIFNLLTEHTPAGIARSRTAARGLIDAAAALGGSFFLTYHRWATRRQLLRCHPRLPELLEAKRRHDPRELFQSEWYRHTVRLLAGRDEL